MKNLLITICCVALLMVSGCALGSASAAYSLEARTAEGLSRKAEDRLIEKIKGEFDDWHDELKE